MARHIFVFLKFFKGVGGKCALNPIHKTMSSIISELSPYAIINIILNERIPLNELLGLLSRAHSSSVGLR